MIAVTGASVTFCRLPSRTRGFSRSFAAKVITNTMRTGKQFALVGPQRIRSYTAASCSRATGLSNHLFWVRALRKIVSSAESSSGVTIRCLLALKAIPLFKLQLTTRRGVTRRDTRQSTKEAVLDVVQQYHADLAQRLADEAALIPRRTAIVERLYDLEQQSMKERSEAYCGK